MWEFGFSRMPSLDWHPLSTPSPEMVYRTLENAAVTRLYPGFDAWFLTKVVPGVRNGERRIVTSVTNGKLSGVAICKRSASEAKLCTMWVSPPARGCGIAAKLASEAFKWLGTNKPLFTVPEERLSEFQNLLRAWAFTDHIEYPGLYRANRVEHVFNERRA